MSACATMMAGSSDSGSMLLMMVTSAGGSRRVQPAIRTQSAMNKTKRAREENRRARLEISIAYFAGAGALVPGAAEIGSDSRLLVAGNAAG